MRLVRRGGCHRFARRAAIAVDAPDSAAEQAPAAPCLTNTGRRILRPYQGFPHPSSLHKSPADRGSETRSTGRGRRDYAATPRYTASALGPDRRRPCSVAIAGDQSAGAVLGRAEKCERDRDSRGPARQRAGQILPPGRHLSRAADRRAGRSEPTSGDVGGECKLKFTLRQHDIEQKIRRLPAGRRP